MQSEIAKRRDFAGLHLSWWTFPSGAASAVHFRGDRTPFICSVRPADDGWAWSVTLGHAGCVLSSGCAPTRPDGLVAAEASAAWIEGGAAC